MEGDRIPGTVLLPTRSVAVGLCGDPNLCLVEECLQGALPFGTMPHLVVWSATQFGDNSSECTPPLRGQLATPRFYGESRTLRA